MNSGKGKSVADAAPSAFPAFGSSSIDPHLPAQPEPPPASIHPHLAPCVHCGAQNGRSATTCWSCEGSLEGSARFGLETVEDPVSRGPEPVVDAPPEPPVAVHDTLSSFLAFPVLTTVVPPSTLSGPLDLAAPGHQQSGRLLPNLVTGAVIALLIGAGYLLWRPGAPETTRPAEPARAAVEPAAPTPAPLAEPTPPAAQPGAEPTTATATTAAPTGAEPTTATATTAAPTGAEPTTATTAAPTGAEPIRATTAALPPSPVAPSVQAALAIAKPLPRSAPLAATATATAKHPAVAARDRRPANPVSTRVATRPGADPSPPPAPLTRPAPRPTPARACNATVAALGLCSSPTAQPQESP